MQVQRVQNNKYNTQFGAKARRVDFSLPILWLTKVNPTYECNFWSSLEFKSSIIFRPLQFSGVGQECPTYICLLPSKTDKKIFGELPAKDKK